MWSSTKELTYKRFGEVPFRAEFAARTALPTLSERFLAASLPPPHPTHKPLKAETAEGRPALPRCPRSVRGEANVFAGRSLGSVKGSAFQEAKKKQVSK